MATLSSPNQPSALMPSFKKSPQIRPALKRVPMLRKLPLLPIQSPKNAR